MNHDEENTPTTRSRSGERRREIACAVFPALLAVGLFFGMIHGGFIYDDHLQIQSNAWIRDSSLFWRAMWSDVAAFSSSDGGPASPYWRPTFVAWMIVHNWFYGVEDATGWRISNVFLHALATSLAFFLCRRLGLTRPLAVAAACVFAVHPSRSENVAWASGVSDLLCAVPMLSALLLVFRLADGAVGERWFWTRVSTWGCSLALYAVALGAKEIAVLFPFIVLAVGLRSSESGDSFTLRSMSLRRAMRLAAPFTAMALVYLAVRHRIVGGVSFPVPGAPDALTTLKTLPLIGAFYVRQALLPWSIGPIYPIRPVASIGLTNVVLPLLLVLVSGAGIVWAVLRTRSRALLVGASLLAFPLAPALNIGSFLPEQLVHDRYLYLPLLGLTIVLLVVGQRSCRNEPRYTMLLAALVSLLCAPLAWQTARYNRVWMSDETLWEWGVRSDPTSTFALTQYGISLMTTGRLDEARRAFEQSSVIRATTRTTLALADLDFRQEKYDVAEKRLGPLVAAPPSDMAPLEYFSAVDLLGRIWLERDDNVPRALALYREVRNQLPSMKSAITDRIGMILAVDDRPDEAIVELESVRAAVAYEGSPQARMVLIRLGQLYAHRGENAKAILALEQFLTLTTGSGEPGLKKLRESATNMLMSLRHER